MKEVKKIIILLACIVTVIPFVVIVIDATLEGYNDSLLKNLLE